MTDNSKPTWTKSLDLEVQRILDKMTQDYLEKYHKADSIKEILALRLEQEAINAVQSNEYNFNDTAVRAKTYYHAAEILRGEVND